MTTPEPLDQRDLDLVAAFAAGMLGPTESSRAQGLIDGDARFADEHSAQLLAISALGGNDWYAPLNDIEKARIRRASVPLRGPKRPQWSVQILKPFSVAAIAVIIVGFASMTLVGGDGDMSLDTQRLSDEATQLAPAAAEVAATEAPAFTEEALDARDTDGVAESAPLVPQFGNATTPPEGDLEALRVEESESLLVFFDLQQWTEPVALIRYINLECWPDALDYDNVLGVSFSAVAGVEYEIVRTTETVEARTVEACESTGAMVLP